MTTIFDAHKNLAYSAVASAPSPATSGTSLVLSAGGGSLFPVAPFNVVCWPSGGATASQSNAEVVRVTAISTDTLTIIRAQEGSAAQSIGVGWQVALTATAKALTDIEGALNATLGGVLTGTLPNPGLASGSVGTSQLAPGAIGTTQLAAGAVTQCQVAVGSTTSPTTNSTTDVDMPDMAVTLTTTGGYLLVWGMCSLANSSSGGSAFVTISLDAGAQVSKSQQAQGANMLPLSIAQPFTGVAAGAHTVKLRWHVDSGSETAQTTFRTLIVLEVRA